ncbi:hypothetical protein Aperf_G00000064746 [Anoplocephala perfoliata]
MEGSNPKASQGAQAEMKTNNKGGPLPVGLHGAHMNPEISAHYSMYLTEFISVVELQAAIPRALISYERSLCESYRTNWLSLAKTYPVAPISTLFPLIHAPMYLPRVLKPGKIPLLPATSDDPEGLSTLRDLMPMAGRADLTPTTMLVMLSPGVHVRNLPQICPLIKPRFSVSSILFPSSSNDDVSISIESCACQTTGEDPALQYEMQLDQIGEYEEAFNKLYELMGTTQISQITEKFKSNEDEINRAVQYTNTNNADSSQLKDEIDHLEEEKLRTLEDMKSSREDFRRQILRLDEEYCQANSQNLALSKTLHSTKRMLKLVLAAIKYLALLVHCTIDAEEDMESLTPYSVERVMTALEERIGSIYSIYRSLKNKPSEGRSREELPESHSGIQSDSAIGEEIAISRSTEDLPSVGGNINHCDYHIQSQRWEPVNPSGF